MKINLDGAVFSDENKSGINVVIRDCSGLVLTSCSKIVRQAYNSSEIEALAAATALSFATDKDNICTYYLLVMGGCALCMMDSHG